MSIDDDFYDIDAHINETEATTDWKVLEVWDRFGTHVRDIEQDNEELRKENNELKTTIRVMMGLKEEKAPPVKRGRSPYDCSVARLK